MPTDTTPFENVFSQWWGATKGNESTGLSAIRKQAFDLFTEAGLPHRRTEEWKYTPIRGLEKTTFQPVWDAPTVSFGQSELDTFVGTNLPGHQMVFVNGYFQSSLSSLPEIADGFAGSVRTALNDEKWSKLLEEQWSRLLDFRNSNPFNWLNQAMMSDGALFVVPDGAEVEEPIHMIYVTTPSDEPAMVHPRNLIVAGKDSKINIIETFVSPEVQTSWTNVASSFLLGENADVVHTKVQREADSVWHFSQVQVELAASSNFHSNYFSFGGGTSRHEIEALLVGENAHCDLNGLYLPEGQQLMVNRICMEHAFPNCTSNQFYKGILGDKSKGVFNGKIYVRQQAQRTDAYQTNQALLLSDDAEIYSKPQLEIFADDVKCSHGATSGYLDDTAMFYLRSRGIAKAEAERILTYAFASDVVQKVEIEPLHDLLESLLQARLDYQA